MRRSTPSWSPSVYRGIYPGVYTVHPVESCYFLAHNIQPRPAAELPPEVRQWIDENFWENRNIIRGDMTAPEKSVERTEDYLRRSLDNCAGPDDIVHDGNPIQHNPFCSRIGPFRKRRAFRGFMQGTQSVLQMQCDAEK